MTNSALSWRLARRELRGGLSGFRVFVISLAVGVAAIASVGSVSQSVVTGLRAEARSLLGGDVDLRLLHRPAEREHNVYLSANSTALSRTIEMRAMARPAARQNIPDANKRAMIELKAIDGAYPLVGTVESDPDIALADAVARRGSVWGAIAEVTLLDRLNLSVGDHLTVGDASFEIRALLLREPDRVANVFNLGPRLMISAEALPETGLVQPGSLIRYHTRVTLLPGTDLKQWTGNLMRQFPTAGWRIRDASGAAPGIQRFVDRMTVFLTFAGLTTLLVGGIGVGNAVKTYMDGKTATIATLKCLGAPTSVVFGAYLLQILALAALGIVIGLVIGTALPALVLWVFADNFPVPIVPGFHVAPMIDAAVLGVLTAFTFALWPLTRAREISAANMFCDVVSPSRKRLRAIFWVPPLSSALALGGFVVLTALDRGLAGWFVGCAVAILLVFRGAAAAIMTAAKRIPRPANAEFRLALGNLSRPGAPTPSVVLSLGTGLAVLVAVALIDANLRGEINDRVPKSAPAFFFIDIQDDQAAAFDATVRGVDGVVDLQRVPSIRGRIVRIAGVPVERVKIAPEAAWAARGDRALTYAVDPPKNVKIVDGTWWQPDYSGPPIVSFDAGVARGFGVGVGDSLTLNVLGREVEVRIASLREIDWRAIPFDFALIFAPGALENAPHSHIAAVYTSPEAENAVEAAVTDRFANVTAIRVGEALEAVNGIIASIGKGVRIAAAMTVGVGALVVAGAIAAGRRRRRYDAVVFKVLGATRGRIARGFVIEYGLLGLITGFAAAVVGTMVAWAVTVFLMRMPWTFMPGAVAATVVACVLLTLSIGFAGTWRVLGQKANRYLRNE
jgi:putative ABC transport system permease protein